MGALADGLGNQGRVERVELRELEAKEKRRARHEHLRRTDGGEEEDQSND